MEGKQYLNAFINNSATIRGILAADLTDAPHKAVGYDSSGRLAVPAADGDPVIGIILSDAPANDSGITKAGTEIDVLIRQTGLAEAGESVKKGDFLTATAAGKVKKAAAGNYIFGIAMTPAAAEGELTQINITHSGYMCGIPGTITPLCAMEGLV